MRILRSIAFAGYLIGILFKILHWPGASILLVSSGALAIIMLGTLLVRKPGPITVELHLPALLVGSLILVLAGGLFKTMHWTGAIIMLLLGLTACASWFVITGSRQVRTA